MILIALGANLPSRYGEPLVTLEKAIECIDAYSDICVTNRSSVYVSAPVPVSDQPWYHNAVIDIEASLSPQDLLGVLQAIEIDFGRIRGERNAARILDLDILAYHDLILEESGLILPHPRMTERAFVVLPLFDIAPTWKHPATGACIGEMLEFLPSGQDIRKIDFKDNYAA